MPRWILIVCAVVVTALLASLLLRRGERERGPTDGAVSIAREGVETVADSSELDLVSDVAPIAARESASATPSVDEPAAPAELPEKPVATLIVRAVDKATRTPLARVRITVSPWGTASVQLWPPGPETLTASDGRLELELPVDVDFALWADGNSENVGDAQYDVPRLALGERREFVVALPTGTDVHYFGRVLAREDKSPIQGAIVEVLGAGGAVTPAAPDGLFELWLSSWKHPEFKVRAPGHAAVFVHVASGHETADSAKVIYLVRSAGLRARILDSSGTVVPDAAVNVWTESYQLAVPDHDEVFLPLEWEDFDQFATNPHTSWRANVDPSGECVLQVLPPGAPLHVELIRDGTIVKRDLPLLVLAPGEVREVEWRLGAGCRIDGLVMDQHSNPIPSLAIWLKRAEREASTVFQDYDVDELVAKTVADAGGRFTFDDVSPGHWWIGPATPSSRSAEFGPQAVATVAEWVELREGATGQDVLLRVHRGLFIHGRVLEPSGELASQAHLFAMHEAQGLYFMAETNADGSFALGPLVPGRYALTASGWKHGASAPLAANGGDKDVELRLRAAGSLRGQVVDKATGSGCGATLIFSHRESDDANGVWWTESHGDGSFIAEGVVPGTYDITARSGGQRIGILRGVSAGPGIETRDLIVGLEPGSTLRLTHGGGEGTVWYRLVSDGVTVGAGGVSTGRSEEIVVPPGRVVVEWGENAEDRESKQLELALGEEKDLRLGGD